MHGSCVCVHVYIPWHFKFIIHELTTHSTQIIKIQWDFEAFQTLNSSTPCKFKGGAINGSCHISKPQMLLVGASPFKISCQKMVLQHYTNWSQVACNGPYASNVMFTTRKAWRL